MIGFLFGLALGTALGFLLGCIAAIGAKTGRVADELFEIPDDLTIDIPARPLAGVRVCSCIGNPQRGPSYVDPHCPFHGDAA
jgi:hypothetical protein